MIDEITEKLTKYFNEHEEVLFAILFGSVAKGISNKMRDIDIAVMVDPNFNKPFPFGYQAELTTDLINVLGDNDVDAVILNENKSGANNYNPKTQ